MATVVPAEQVPGVAPGTMDADRRAKLADAWRAIASIPDPEIPVVSIVELGILRSLAIDDDGATVIVTPTYSGCPATSMIVEQIRTALASLGLPSRVEFRLAPAWTTDWMAPEAQARLAAYGIAPPGAARPGVAVVDVRGLGPRVPPGVVIPCPRCGSEHTVVTAQFGSTACKALYRCLDCREPFDHFKPH
jgi:ring-1,2-phenylacetyl-CoA epoxidase subunit PaaD